MLSTEAALRKDKGKKADMQHRHFATIATIISELPKGKERERVALHFADGLRYTNGNFDRERFLRACDVVTGVGRN